MAVGVVDSEQHIHYQGNEPSIGLTEDELVVDLGRELEEARDARPDVLAAGLGIPATIDHDRGVAIQAVNLEISDVPLRDLMTKQLGLPVYMDNDANVAALAEFLFGAGRGARNVVMLTIGTGIGGGLILDGDIYRGSIGAGAELGHIVVEEDGPPCQGNCPNHGCVESLASGTALGREARAAGESAPDSALGKAVAEGKEIDGRVATEAALAGDETAIEVFELIGSRLGVACASFANIFQPHAIVIGGGVIAAGDLLLEPARREVRERALDPMNKTPILEATLGNDAGMIGAAALARTELAKAGSTELARDGG